MQSSRVVVATSAKLPDEDDPKLANPATSAAKKASPSPSCSSNSTCSSCCCDPSPNSKLDMASKPSQQQQCSTNKLNHVHFCEDELDSANSGPLPSTKWRSSPSPARSFENPNLTLHRALLALRKQQKPVPTSYGGSSDQVASCTAHNRQGAGCTTHQCTNETGNCNGQSIIKGGNCITHNHHNHHHCVEVDPGRSITNSDARTLSMRERGRWGNTKMCQQQRHSGGGNGAAAELPFDEAAPDAGGNLHRQPLNHFQCLHCGSFSTTPLPPKGGSLGSGGVSSGPRVRRLRDYSWQQEMLHKKEFGAGVGLGGGGGASIPAAVASAAARAAACEDRSDPYDCRRCSHGHAHGSMTWQEKYMMLCEAIAAGAAFGEDACCGDDCGGGSGGPAALLARHRRRYMCDIGNRSFGHTRGDGGYCSTANSERMMELEAFSGPLGYVSESKGEGLVEEAGDAKSVSRGKWWARLPSFAKSKSERLAGAKAAPPGASAQATASCDSCGQRMWVQGDVGSGPVFCPDCHGRGLGASPEHGLFGQALGGGCRPPCFTPSATHRPPSLHFPYKTHKHCPRRWRLVKLCRYLLGFPMQR